MYSRRLAEAIIDTDYFLLFRSEQIARHVNSFLPQNETKRSSIMIPKQLGDGNCLHKCGVWSERNPLRARIVPGISISSSNLLRVFDCDVLAGTSRIEIEEYQVTFFGRFLVVDP